MTEGLVVAQNYVKVIFRAKVKNVIPTVLADKIRAEAKKVDGFIRLATTTDNNIETTTSYWKSMIAVNEWSQNRHHRKVKDNASYYYYWHEFIIEENQQYPPTQSVNDITSA